MRRGTPEYTDAIGRVKVSIFTEPPFNLDITGLIHVGTNYGYEMKWYQRMGIRNLIGVEPLPSACAQFRLLYPEVTLLPYALGDQYEASRQLQVYAGDGQGSTLLKELSTSPNIDNYMLLPPVEVSVLRFDEVDLHSLGWRMQSFNCLVIDVQGFELQVLKGFGSRLDQIEMLSVELSREPLYEGEAYADGVCVWLSEKGFMRISPIEDHNDVFFVRRSVYSGQH